MLRQGADMFQLTIDIYGGEVELGVGRSITFQNFLHSVEI